MLKLSSLTLWVVTKEILFDYSCILMKTLEINEKNHEKSRGNTHKITHVLEYQILYQSNSKSKNSYLMGCY